MLVSSCRNNRRGKNNGTEKWPKTIAVLRHSTRTDLITPTRRACRARPNRGGQSRPQKVIPLAHRRTSIAPETTRSKRNERDQNRTKPEQNQRNQPLSRRSSRSGCRFESCRTHQGINGLADSHSAALSRTAPETSQFVAPRQASTVSEITHRFRSGYAVSIRS
jgi:hypothetical protein